MISKIDLHMHSTASDGSDTPEELLQRIQSAGIRTFSLTDHDSIEGALKLEKLVPDGLRFFRGIEFSCYTEVKKCHILGYGYDSEHPAFQAALKEGRDLRMEKLERRLRYLKEAHGIEFTEEERAWLRSMNSPGKPHISRLLIRRGLVSTIQEAIDRYIDDQPGRESSDPGSWWIRAETAVRAILSSGGVPVWAHPLGGEGETRLTREEFERQLDILCGFGIRGLECWYSRYDRADVDFLLGEASSRALLVSGGSDCHGRNKNIPAGMLNDFDRPVSEEDLTILRLL